jgi:DNA-binding response OmpR family regulator
VRAQEFDVVLLDISMPDKNGIDTLKTLKHVRPELPILMLSGYSEDQYAVNLLRAGASGYLNKEAASTQLVGAIRTVVHGRKFVSPCARTDPRRWRHGRRRPAAARRALAARVPDFLQARGRSRGLEDRRRIAFVGEDSQHVSHARSRKDGDEVECRSDLLRDQERAHKLIARGGAIC